MSYTRTDHLPKSIQAQGARFSVRIFSKETKITHYVGLFDTLDEAIKERDKWVVANYNLVKGYLPRGVTFNKRTGKYKTYISFPKLRDGSTRYINLKEFDTIQEAVNYRTKIIMGLL